MCAEHPADGAVVIALKVAQQVAVGLICHVNHILVIQEGAQLWVRGHILFENPSKEQDISQLEIKMSNFTLGESKYFHLNT